MPTFRRDNDITLLKSGAEYFPALETAIDGALREVHLETYIFADDPTGRRIAQALIRAVQRGVAVRLVVDGFGTRAYSGRLLEELAGQGVEVAVYRPEGRRSRFRKNRLRRLHRKITVVDGRIAFVGGINVIDDMNTPRHVPPRFDYAVRIEGPLLSDIYPVIRRLWLMLRWIQLSYRAGDLDEPPVVSAPAGRRVAAFVYRDNLRHRRDIEEQYLSAIENARSEIIIANAYFFPGTSFRRALAAATKRGVRVVLLLQGRVEYVLLHYASRALYGTLLNAGVEIIEYHKSFMHAKVAVFDTELATVGSSNIDPFSLFMSREANVWINDSGFAQELRESLQGAMQHGARPLEQMRWRDRSYMERVMTWVCYGVARLMMGFVGYAHR
jgi:cardiolipin synthase A/B